MENYNTNIIGGVHEIKVTFQQFDYKGYIVDTMGGNCYGKSMLEFDSECLDSGQMENLKENNMQLSLNEEYNTFDFVLKNENGDELLLEGIDDYEFNNMVVGIEIINFK